MVARKLFVLFAVAVFSLGLASAGLSSGTEMKGSVTRIEGDQVSIIDKMGNEKTILPTNPGVLTDLKVGDLVSVKDGHLTKLGGIVPSAPSPGHKY
jgi:hypothetical protein